MQSLSGNVNISISTVFMEYSLRPFREECGNFTCRVYVSLYDDPVNLADELVTGDRSSSLSLVCGRFPTSRGVIRGHSRMPRS
jgi:hypothetical protein